MHIKYIARKLKYLFCLQNTCTFLCLINIKSQFLDISHCKKHIKTLLIDESAKFLFCFLYMYILLL